MIWAIKRQKNDAWLDPQKTTSLIQYEIEEEDAKFINVFRKGGGKKEFLLITTSSTHSIQSAYFQ